MAKQSIAQLKQWFQTGDYPTQQQFYDWMESFFHKDEPITMGSITGLIEQLQAINNWINNHTDNGGGGGAASAVVLIGTNTWTAPADTLIEKIVIVDPVALIVSAGKTNGAKDLIEDAQIQPPHTIITYDLYFSAEQQIFFTGITANTIIKIYRR